ncbi:MAG: hypothetical protein IJS19_03500 [Muribaculaceae bacterium]|nr:hypothetical protein [Muribaculaceae bacterium]
MGTVKSPCLTEYIGNDMLGVPEKQLTGVSVYFISALTSGEGGTTE